MAPLIFLTRRIPAEARTLLDQAATVRAWDHEEPPVPRPDLLQGVADANGLYCLLTDAVDEELLRAAPRLRVVSTMAVGYDHIDVAACTRRGIPVCNTPGVLTESTADLAFALLMAAARRLPEAERTLRQGRWQTWSPLFLAGQDVHGKTLGIIGAGRIGQAVGARARGFGMEVLYTARSSKPAFEAACQARRCADLDELLAASDFVSVHAPLTTETRHMIGERQLRRMKPTAILINTARGPLVDEAALRRALHEGWICAAGLDVFEREPLPTDHPLLQLPNVVALPHIGSASVATRTAMATLAAENLLAVLAGRTPAHCVNPETLSR